MPLTVDEEIELNEILAAEVRHYERRKLWAYFPDTGPLRRDLYAKQTEFFKAGATHTMRLFCICVTGASHGEVAAVLVQFVAPDSTACPRWPPDARICAVRAYRGRYGKSPAPDGVGPF